MFIKKVDRNRINIIISPLLNLNGINNFFPHGNIYTYNLFIVTYLFPLISLTSLFFIFFISLFYWLLFFLKVLFFTLKRFNLILIINECWFQVSHKILILWFTRIVDFRGKRAFFDFFFCLIISDLLFLFLLFY